MRFLKARTLDFKAPTWISRRKLWFQRTRIKWNTKIRGPCHCHFTRKEHTFPGGQNTQINTIIGLQLSYVVEFIFIPLNHLQLSTNKCLKAVHIYNIPTNGAIIMKIERDSHWIVINTLVVFISSKQYPSAFADIFDEETWYQFFFVFTCCTFVCVFILSRLHNFGIRHFIWVSSAQRQFYWIFCLWYIRRHRLTSYKRFQSHANEVISK